MSSARGSAVAPLLRAVMFEPSPEVAGRLVRNLPLNPGLVGRARLLTLARIASGLDVLPGDLLPRSKEELLDHAGRTPPSARAASLAKLESVLETLPREERKRALVLVRSLVKLLEI